MPQIDKSKLSPMMQQYLSIKEKYSGLLLFFRLGDFYEMFFEDAETVSRELELTLTGRDCGQGIKAPMCGVPYHSATVYISRLIHKGYKVAICDQMTTPGATKGIVEREVTRVVTPGTLLETDMLDEGINNYICSIYAENVSETDSLFEFGIAFCDISTGEIHLTQMRSNSIARVENELSRFSPVEIIYNKSFLQVDSLNKFLKERNSALLTSLDDKNYNLETCKEIVLKQFQKDALKDVQIETNILMVGALGGLVSYLYDTQHHGLESLCSIDVYEDKDYMRLDATARRNLELIQTIRSGEKRGSLLWVLDKTKTAMGKRLMRSWIEKPLLNPTLVNKRLNAVEELVSNSIRLEDILELLSKIFDIERLITKIVFGNVTPRELKSLEYTFQKMPQLKECLSGLESIYLNEINSGIDPLEDICTFLDYAIEAEPPAMLKDGGVIKEGYSPELDKLRRIVKNTKGILAEIEAAEREKTGIKNLRIGFNNVFGYFIEVTKSFIDKVPQEYIRKQTLTGSERYITQELKELEETILGARDKIMLLEQTLYDDVRKVVVDEINRIQKTASSIARLDVFTSLAKVAVVNNYSRPQVDFSDNIDIIEGRHPVVENMTGDNIFVSNNTLLDCRDNRIAIITGPNMAGKSTYMRQTALIILLAQMGSFVPAKGATIGVVDGIYTRVGASDDLSSGQSTFMIEMSEVAQILKNATSRSLLILDEIGRGTSTFDGMSVARAVIEHIANKRKLGAKTLFATHYHELTELEEQIPGIKNYNIAVKKKGDDIIFLRRIVRGGTDDSYGIYVSKLAGIPNEILQRAKEILKELENGKSATQQNPTKQTSDDTQMMMIQTEDSEIVRRLKEIEVDKITPIQALVLLGELKQLV